jgi:predicted transposase YbfD/YdcC
VDTSETDKGHGRIETRRRQVFEKGLMVDDAHNRKGLQSVIKITSSREIRGKVTTEERYYISSPDPRQPFNAFIRNHWEVENKLHRTSDMALREDEQRKRTKHAAENFAIVRKIALNILKKDSGKESLCSKRLKAAWNRDFLINLIKINTLTLRSRVVLYGYVSYICTLKKKQYGKYRRLAVYGDYHHCRYQQYHRINQ